MVNDDPPGNKNSSDDASKQGEENEAVSDIHATTETTNGSTPTTSATATATAPSQVIAIEDNDDDDDEEGSTDGTENEKTVTGPDFPGYSADQSTVAAKEEQHIAIHKTHKHPPAAVTVVVAAAATEETVEMIPAAVAAAAETAPVVIVKQDDKDTIVNNMMVTEVSVITSSQQQTKDKVLELQQQQQQHQEEKQESCAQVVDLQDPLLTSNVQKMEDFLSNIEDADADTYKRTVQDEYVNVGLQHWEKQRLAWLAHDRNNGLKKYEADKSVTPAVTDRAKDSKNVPFQAVPVDVDEIIDVIFQSPKQWREEGGPRRFPCAVPLPQMVDILQDLWEAEGLDT